MIQFKLSYDVALATTLESMVVKALNTDLAASKAAGKKSLSYMKLVHKAALRVTAARVRKSLVSIITKNRYGWAEHQTHPNWFGSQGAVVIGHLTRANRPIKRALATTRFLRGLKGKGGYSQQKAINPPQAYPIGGRLVKAMRYKVDDDNFTVGVLPSASTKQKNKAENFQDGGKIGTPSPEASRKYLAAIGIYIKRSTLLTAKPRPLIAPYVSEAHPDSMFANAFDDMMNDKLRVGA